jgi:hypothetical protein
MSATERTPKIAEAPGRERMSPTAGSKQQHRRQQQQKLQQQLDFIYSREVSHSRETSNCRTSSIVDIGGKFATWPPMANHLFIHICHQFH